VIQAVRLDKKSETSKRLKKIGKPFLWMAILFVVLYFVYRTFELDMQLDKWIAGDGPFATIAGHIKDWGVEASIFAAVLLFYVVWSASSSKGNEREKRGE